MITNRLDLLLLICQEQTISNDAKGQPFFQAEEYSFDRFINWAKQEGANLRVMEISLLTDGVLTELKQALITKIDCLLIAPGMWHNHPIWQELLVSWRGYIVQIRPDVTDYTKLQNDALTKLCTRSIFGRLEKTFRWAIRHACNSCVYPYKSLPYGAHPDQYGDLRIPEGVGPFPVCLIFHGGFWRHSYRRDMTDNLALSLVQNGFVTWNVDYRTNYEDKTEPCVASLEDASKALAYVNQLKKYAEIDLNNLIVIGHSAGGLLATWASLNTDQTHLLPKGCVSIAGILDLHLALAKKEGHPYVTEWLGQMNHIEKISPIFLPPPQIKLLLAHGLMDETVDPAHSIRYFNLLSNNFPSADLMLFEGADHMDLVKTGSPSWITITNWLLNQVDSNSN